MAIKHLAGERIQGTAAERAALETTQEGSAPNNSWKEIGRFTVSGSDVDSIVCRGLSSATSGTFADKDNLMILIHIIGDDGDTNFNVRFGDTSIDSTANNYESVVSQHGGADSNDGDGDSDGIKYGGYGSYTQGLYVIQVRNITGSGFHGKSAEGKYVFQYGYSAANNTGRGEGVGTWKGSGQIGMVEVHNNQSGGFSAGSEIVVLGCDDDEADSGANFWQEIGSVNASGSETQITLTKTFPKYMMFSCYGYGGSGDHGFFFNNDESGSDNSSGKMTRRFSQNNGTDNTASTQYRHLNNMMKSGSTGSYAHGFIVNVAGKAKIFYGVTSTDGNEHWEWSSKYAPNDSVDALITRMDLKSTSGNYSSDTNLRVWGSN